MKFGISDQHLQVLDGLVIRPLKIQGCRVFLFGSRVTGQHHPYSDVDLLYRTSSPLPAGFLSNLKESLEDSRFPYSVDLVDERDLAVSYRDNITSNMIEL